MKVFVISLERATERREYIKSHFSALNVDYEIIDAVDYKQLTDHEFATLASSEAMAKNPYLTKGMVACALSHVKIFKKIVNDNIEKALVVEDDVSLPKNIDTILREIESVVADDEVITLSYYSHSGDVTELSNKGAISLASGNKLFYPVDIECIASTMAYIITRSVAEKMADILMPISVQPDYWGVYYEKGAFKSFKCLYPIQAKPAAFRSTLDYASASSLKSRLASFVRNYKVPFLYSYLEKRSQNLIDQKHAINMIEKKPFHIK
ncbi:glycosyltransferase family 25 protein [Hymenobacter weizhouensis]|uniref:glycosyltransferase family 25 protein n=1 Tax=Hymenobacter sp. YIM 151500-1 TaxID=2987689 RepID=UPI00222739A8|nr:glycosyltransferase family 25 protein [Hymenobacter sp. YIM 151500-1]UYZ61359.1 glycosyltransferase family 25 protein [Hymenobacter sp. YIM 151500-1]